MRRFEVWLANLNPTKGTEPGKVRPVVIFQTDLLNKAEHPSTIIFPITTNVLPRETKLRVRLKSQLEFMDHESEILVDQIRAIDNRRLLHKLGELDKLTSFELIEKTRIVLDL